MKRIIKLLTLISLGLTIMPGCKKDFLNRPPKAAPTSGTFYQSDEEILEGTGPLYNGSWGGYNGTSLQYIGDVMGGNSTTDNYNGRGAYLNFSVSATDPSGALQSAYQALWSVVANANVVAYNIKNAGSGATPAGKNAGLAECYFMRAAAYYYLALIWGPVPIIYDNSKQIGDTSIRRNNLTDAWQFIINDLEWSMKYLPTTPVQPGRITKWSAEGMLARAFLVRAGVTGGGGGKRTQSDLDSAKLFAGDVCNNSGLSLMANYYDLFTSKYFSGTNVPNESLFSLLWVPTGQWFVQNHMQANLAYSALITQTGDGWGGAFGGSPNLMQYYFNNPDDSIRRRATVFMPNANYPDINVAGGGWHVDTALFNNAVIKNPGDKGNGYGSDHAYVKKYVIGSPADNNNLGGQQNENLSTYIYRLSDVYLVYADAILGNNSTTTDPEALKYYNAVRTRAGVATKSSISYLDLLWERKVEFAFEGHAFYDWKTWYYFDPTNALAWFSSQDRGNYNITYNGGNSFLTLFGSDGYAGTVSYPITAATADLPYPESELLVAPILQQSPVPFDFSKVKY
jgi:hypothetical protein